MPGALNILNALATKGVEAVPKCVLVLGFLACVLRKKPFERQQQTTIFRLWTGYCRLLPHVFWLWLAHTEDCLRPGEPQSPEHVLQFCPIFREVRTQQRPHEATLQEQLLGNRTRRTLRPSSKPRDREFEAEPCWNAEEGGRTTAQFGASLKPQLYYYVVKPYVHQVWETDSFLHPGQTVAVFLLMWIVQGAVHLLIEPHSDSAASLKILFESWFFFPIRRAQKLCKKSRCPSWVPRPYGLCRCKATLNWTPSSLIPNCCRTAVCRKWPCSMTTALRIFVLFFVVTFRK